MTNEEYELSEKAFYEEEFGHGPADPDIVGYPNRPDEVTAEDKSYDPDAKPF